MQDSLKMYFQLTETATYKAPETDKGYCAIKGTREKPEHCNCEYTNEDITFCKERCDVDRNCKGYSYRKFRTTCYLYTTSSCSKKNNAEKCKKKKRRKLGDLMHKEKKDSKELGCYIKISSNSFLLRTI